MSDFNLDGKTFGIKGSVALANGSLAQADFSSVRLNRDDDVAVTITKSGNSYSVDISGKALDARSLVKQFTADTSTATKATAGGSVSVSADVKVLTGFHGERLSNVKLDYSGSGQKVNGLEVTATASSGAAIEIRNVAEAGGRTMRMQSADAGAILRFLDIYEHMEGGKIELSLKGGADGPMAGQVDARDFFLVNEPRLGSLVSTTPPGGEQEPQRSGQARHRYIAREIRARLHADRQGRRRFEAFQRRAARARDRRHFPGHALRQKGQHGHDGNVHACLRLEPHLRRDTDHRRPARKRT